MPSKSWSRGLPLCALISLLVASVGGPAVCGDGSQASGFDSAVSEGTGAGGSGLSSGEGEKEGKGTGTGGTGARGDRDLLAGGESGTGGTGVQGEDGTGTGGTGVLGIVTAFGSICVNDLEVEYDVDTPVERDGREVSAAELAVGQVVRIETRRDDPLRARRISVESALAGPVERVDPGRRRVFIMGQAVELRPRGLVFDLESRPSSDLGALGPGTYLEVSGLRRSDGVVAASRLDQRPATTHSLVTGIARQVAPRNLYVGAVRVELARAASPSDSVAGLRVRVRGRWDPETATLEEARVQPAPAHAPGVENLSIQGFVAPARGENDFHIAGTELDVSGVDPGLRELPVDSLVRVEGRLDDRGRLHARRIVVEERGRARLEDGQPGERTRGRSGRGDRMDRSDRQGRADRSDRMERPERSERPERPGRSGH